MASSLLTCAASPSFQTPKTTRRRSDGLRINAGNTDRKSWWGAPLFGWSTEPDYIDGGENEKENGKGNRNSAVAEIVEESEGRNLGTLRISKGSFTEEKAKALRMKTMESSSFHDIMYHSGIASRLASQRPNRRIS